MSKVSQYLILATCLVAWNESSFAGTPQTITTAGTFSLTTGANSGQSDGVLFTTGATTNSFVTIATGQPINTNANPAGVVTTVVGGVGTLQFLGTTGTSVVNGTVSAPTPFILANITGALGSSEIIFNGEVFATTFDAGPGTVLFNGGGIAALTFTGDGTVNVAAGQTFTGATTTNAAATGTLILNSGSIVTGGVGDASIAAPIKQLTITGNATINGAVAVDNISLGAFTLGTAALTLDGPNPVINTTIVSDTVLGNITATACSANVTVNTPLTVNANVTGTLTGVPLILVCGGAGSNGSIVNVFSNNPKYSFTGLNVTGKVILFPSLHLVPSGPGGGGGSATTPAPGPLGIFECLFPIAGANPGSDLATIIAALSALSPAGVLDAGAQMDPNVNGSVPLVSFNASKQFTNLWSKHMGYGRCVYATECEDECCVREVKRRPRQTECCETGCSTELNCENVCNSFEVWGDAFGYFGEQNERDGFKGYDARIFGGMVGFQAPLSQMTSVGLGGGYADSQIQERDHGSIQTYDLTAYFSYDPTNFYVDAAVSFDFNRYKGSRKIDFPGIDRKADSHYNGQEYSGLVAAGYRFYTSWCGVITPIASLLYSYLHVNSYHEHGAGDLDLHVKKQSYNFLESSLGLKLSQIIQTDSGAIVPEVHGIWLHDFRGDPMDLTSTFSGLSATCGSFKTNGPSQDRNYGDVGAGITFITCSNLAFELVYNYEFGKTYHSQEGLLKITQRF